MESFEKRIRLYINGMTCVNCQNKIERKLTQTRGIVSARVSYSKGTADIVYNEHKISLKKIAAVIEGMDYEVLSEKGQPGLGIKKTAGLLGIIAALYILLQWTGILNLLAPGQLADTKMGYGMLFVIGLLTSVHCIAMCGGINLSQCIPRTEQKEAKAGGRLDVFYPALAYNMGRVLSYTAVGFLLGLLGFLVSHAYLNEGTGEAGLPVFLQGVLKMTAGLFMVIMGTNMLGLFPGLRKLTVRMPGFLARPLGKKRAGSRRPFIVGILNGFMPCGPLQSMWIVALASGSPFAGAWSMFLFSLGTVPLMLGLGSIVSVLGRKFADKVMTAGAVLVVVLGLSMLSQGGSLSGCISPDLLFLLVIAICLAGVLLSIPARKRLWKHVLKVASLVLVIGSGVFGKIYGTPVQNDPAVEAEAGDGVQVINSTLVPGRYPNITVRAGVPVKWVIDAPEGSINGCNYKILIRDYDIEYTFQTGENIIEFTPEKEGTVRYSCWMGMIYGTISVTDDAEAVTAESGGEAGSLLPDESVNPEAALGNTGKSCCN